MSERGTGGGGPERERVRTLLVAYADTRDPAVREQLVALHVGLARALAFRFAHRGEPLDDVYQVACLGLLNALERYDPGAGVAFTTFATPTIIGEIRRYFRDRTASIRLPRRMQELRVAVSQGAEALTGQLGRVPTTRELSAHLAVSEVEVIEVVELGESHGVVSLDAELRGDGRSADRFIEHLGQLDMRFEAIDRRLSLVRAFERLDHRERLLLHLRFTDGLSQSKTASALGISQMHVSRLQALALRKLRVALDDPEEARSTGEELA